MGIPITDQFLWLLYNLGGEISGPLGEIFRLRGKQDLNPEAREFWKAIEKKKAKKQFAQFINYLKKKGYIKDANLKAGAGFLLTKAGEEKALNLKYKLLDKKERKDRKWIMIMYDIPEKKKRQRFFLRKKLKELGYKRLQNSIWVSPYDVFKETEKTIEEYFLSPYIKIFLIEEINLK
jgi:DNA-binding transcriptional regulator PaaX